MQICPLYENAPDMHLARIALMFMPFEMITAALPPSSSTTFFFPACDFSFQPTGGEPVKLSIAMRGSVARRVPVSRVIGRMETLPAGTPASWMILASSRVDSGVVEAGLRMIGQPLAMAGAIL